MITVVSLFAVLVATGELARRYAFVPPKPILRGKCFRAPGESLEQRRAPTLTLVVNKPMKEWP